MSFLKNGNWGLKLLALALAIIIYQTLKNETPSGRGSANTTSHDHTLFSPR